MGLYNIDYFSLRKYFLEEMSLGQFNTFDFSTQPIFFPLFLLSTLLSTEPIQSIFNLPTFTYMEL